jgi:D-alanyl-D-alanine carboxypeptidase
VRLTTQELDDHLDAVLRTGVPGVAVVVAGPDFTRVRAAGVSDVESRAPMTVEHRFRIASVTKLFVATVVLSSSTRVP